jgi:hypothetical protein
MATAAARPPANRNSTRAITTFIMGFTSHREGNPNPRSLALRTGSLGHGPSGDQQSGVAMSRGFLEV